MTSAVPPPTEFLGMSDQFWSSVVGALLGAAAAGLISLLVARWIFRSERDARALELTDEHARRDRERAEDQRYELRKLRVETVSSLIGTLRKYAASGGFSGIPIELENATSSLLLDGTNDSYTVYQWVSMQLGRISQASVEGKGNVAPQTSRVIISMLLGWVRDEEQGVLATMKQNLADSHNDD